MLERARQGEVALLTMEDIYGGTGWQALQMERNDRKI